MYVVRSRAKGEFRALHLHSKCVELFFYFIKKSFWRHNSGEIFLQHMELALALFCDLATANEASGELTLNKKKMIADELKLLPCCEIQMKISSIVQTFAEAEILVILGWRFFPIFISILSFVVFSVLTFHMLWSIHDENYSVFLCVFLSNLFYF